MYGTKLPLTLNITDPNPKQKVLSESLTEVSEEDLEANANLLTSTSSSLHVRFESAAKKLEITADEYRKLLRGLNTNSSEQGKPTYL